MIPDRYPAPYAATTWHPQNKVGKWFHLTKMFMKDAIWSDTTLTPRQQDQFATGVDRIEQPTPEAVVTREATTHHDVVAFLSLVEDTCPIVLKRYLHYGLTSSDLVENQHFGDLREHAGHMAAMITDLGRVLATYNSTKNYPRAGRTHGQLADVTSLGHQFHVHQMVCFRIGDALRKYAEYPIVKTAGPTGTSPFRYASARAVSQRMGGVVIPSTQMLPRDFQLEWAALYLRAAGELEAIATLIRCGARSDVRELAEGTGSGSSSMPHKKNPVASEKVCGLARVARGHFAAIAESVAFWDDRDISNSSLERIAVPDLAATVEHMLHTTTQVILNLQVDEGRMEENACDPHTASSILQTLAQKHFAMGPIEASQYVRDTITFDTEDGVFYLQDFKSTEANRAWINEARGVWRGRF